MGSYAKHCLCYDGSTGEAHFLLNMKIIYLYLLFITVQLFNFQNSYSSNLSSSKTLLNASHLAHSSHIKQQVVQIIKVGTVVIPVLNSLVLDHFEYSDNVYRLIVCSKKSLIFGL